VQQSPAPSQQIPPDVARYLKGATTESHQFDFLIGQWDVAATRYKEDGSALLQYRASWRAESLNDGRMIMDDFKALGPRGEPVSSFVTLRTYSEVTRRWELQGLAALQPSAPVEWHGVWKDGEMLLDATGRRPDGQSLRTRIRFFQIQSDRFSWESNVSLDDGKNWVRNASLTATRVPRGG
jgi:hypothetical protein